MRRPTMTQHKICPRCNKAREWDAEECVDHDPIYCPRLVSLDGVCVCPTVCPDCCTSPEHGSPPEER